jgi:hypothetical protein
MAEDIEDFPPVIFQSYLFLRGIIPGGGLDIAVQFEVSVPGHLRSLHY